MRHWALTDSLTGAANRRGLAERIEYEVARHTRQSRKFAIVMIDLDGFKLVNDRFGHHAGDELLRDVAAALREAVRDQDTVARLGGDEFCVLAPETDRAGAAHLADRVRAAVHRVTTGLDTLSASVGAAVFPDDGKDPTTVFQAADDAQAAAKRRSRASGSRRPRRVA
jgi:diguanylate cyclase (GGDEF)-like protein